MRLRSLPLSTRRAITARLEKSRTGIAKEIYRELGADQVIGSFRIQRLAQLSRVMDSFFRFSVRYLGPLRADPRPLYPLQASANPTDVGPKGEQTAAVLHLNGKRPVATARVSSSSEEGFQVSGDRLPLLEAVREWLTYLGVAEEIRIIERGKLGHELRVRASGSSEFQDLTNVGVGVSQVLPIVVSCLLAEPGSVLILEQPELHLHPAVQSRLADLFIAMSQLGKQVLIETHSEHIIERLRLRIAGDLTDRTHRESSVYYLELSGGLSQVRSVKITPFGGIPDWPRGFFDQSQTASEQIVLKALARRSARAPRPVANSEAQPAP